MQAYVEGKQIQYLLYNEWMDIDKLTTDDLYINPELYRIKPELKYRPFKNAEECWKEMENHSHFGWIKFNGEENSCIHCEAIEDCGIFYNSASWTFESIFKEFTFIDGSPFGVKIDDE